MQVDKELATGEFFLRESVKKRKKMEEIKVSSEWSHLLLACSPVILQGAADVVKAQPMR